MSVIHAGILSALRPGDTNAHRLFCVRPPSVKTTVKSMIVCNLSGGALTYRIFATTTENQTYDGCCAQFYDVSIAANSTHTIDMNWLLSTGQTIGVRSSSANNITFTIFGEEEDTLE